jgi:2-methylcitrate dehydratase PrpD
MSAVDPTPSATLARFASTLAFDHVPSPVLRRAEDLFLDWFGSALAGKGARAVEAIERFARATIFALADVPHIGRLLADSSTTITPAPTLATT